MNLATQPRSNPLHVFLAERGAGRSEHPVPMVSCAYSVTLEAGLAVVTNTRTFQNEEKQSIEATLTFPVPVHAVVFELRAKVGDRTLVARAEKKEAARASYEDAIDRGKTAVLHEEVLRGIHMLSIAHIPPGAKIEVTCSWVMTLAIVNSEGHLRIPLTVGHVYGHSPLSDADDLATGGKTLTGNLIVNSPDATVRLVDGTLQNGQAKVQLNRPIDLVVARWTPRLLQGVTAKGRQVSMRIQPAPMTGGKLDMAVLVDHSGSMNQAAGASGRSQTKHAEVKAALRSLSRKLELGDSIELWEFDDKPARIGSTMDKMGLKDMILPRPPGKRLESLVDRLSDPAGGTEIGKAIANIIEQSRVCDILVITDGKSHALDVQELARSGRRVSALLVGEDSLEANIGHLAALTGGEILVSGGADLADCFEVAIASLRRTAGDDSNRIDPESGKLVHLRGGAKIELSESGQIVQTQTSTDGRAVAAMWASLRLPALSISDAADLAASEGLVTHLTSLVLVDEAGECQDGLPRQRKVLLPEPATTAMFNQPQIDFASRPRPMMMKELGASYQEDGNNYSAFGPSSRQRRLNSQGATSSAHSAEEIAKLIDWGKLASELAAGDVSALPPGIQSQLHEMAEHEDIKLAASQAGIEPLVLVISLVASFAGKAGGRQVERLTRLATKKLDRTLLTHLRSLI